MAVIVRRRRQGRIDRKSHGWLTKEPAPPAHAASFFCSEGNDRVFLLRIKRRFAKLKKSAPRSASKADPGNQRRAVPSPADALPSYVNAGNREILVPASVRIAREKATAKLRAVRDKATARATLQAAREERAIARAALRIAKTLDRKAALKEREAAKLDRQAQRVAFRLARKDRLEEQSLMRRARRVEVKAKRKQARPGKRAKG